MTTSNLELSARTQRGVPLESCGPVPPVAASSVQRRSRLLAGGDTCGARVNDERSAPADGLSVNCAPQAPDIDTYLVTGRSPPSSAASVVADRLVR